MQTVNLDKLPPQARLELLDFYEFLLEKHAPSEAFQNRKTVLNWICLGIRRMSFWNSGNDSAGYQSCAEFVKAVVSAHFSLRSQSSTRRCGKSDGIARTRLHLHSP